MTRIVCPRCGAVQDSTAECVQCGIIFSRYKGQPPRRFSRLWPQRRRGVLWYLRWIGLAAAIVMLALVFWGGGTPAGLTNPEAMRNAESKFLEHQRLAEAHRPHTLELDQPELNGWLETHLVMAPEVEKSGRSEIAAASAGFDDEVRAARSTVRDVKIELFEDSLRAHVVFDFHGVDMTLVLAGRLMARDGYLRFEPTGGKLGLLPIPQSSLQSAVRRLFDAPENKEKFRLPAEIHEVGIREGRLFVNAR
jgi:hypothetical protein